VALCFDDLREGIRSRESFFDPGFTLAVRSIEKVAEVVASRVVVGFVAVPITLAVEIGSTFKRTDRVDCAAKITGTTSQVGR
jgi:hypothetical protein